MLTLRTRFFRRPRLLRTSVPLGGGVSLGVSRGSAGVSRGSRAGSPAVGLAVLVVFVATFF